MTPTSPKWGRFTRYGSGDLEARITSLISEAAEIIHAALSPREYKAVLLIGGYGRGEGGVEVINGIEHPHNNLDFLVITTRMSTAAREAIRHRLLEALLPVFRAYSIEIDLSTIDALKLSMSTSLVIWYDMRFGHKTVLGDSAFVPSLKHFCVDRIPAWDMRNLLVNRGTLLLVNEEILKETVLDLEQRKRVVRNAMKAIIGYGDALLFFLGHYDWSYAERQRRMREVVVDLSSIRELYDMAMGFRFRPDYVRYINRDLRSWMAELRRSLEAVHLFCEAKHLGRRDLDWEVYPEVALRHWALSAPFSARDWCRKLLCLLHAHTCPPGFSPLARLGYRLSGPRSLYAIAFPAVAYEFQDSRFQRLATATLRTGSSDRADLRLKYLEFWCRAVDINSSSILRLWRIPELGETESV